MVESPLVSVFMITYNHENYISEAIESVLMQETSFPVELVIGEDFSQDKTREIVRGYKKKYPKKIKLILNPTNLGAQKNAINVYRNCTGKYIAFCEGDDYWTDSQKLKKQVNFLEKKSNYSACFHNARTIIQNSKKKWNYCSFSKNQTFEIQDILKQNFIPTASLVFRNTITQTFLKKIENINCGDWALHIYNAKRGKIYYFNEIMSVYRAHDNGVWIGLSKDDSIKFRIDIIMDLNKMFDYEYEKEFRDVLCNFAIDLKNQIGIKSLINKVFLKLSRIKI